MFFSLLFPYRYKVKLLSLRRQRYEEILRHPHYYPIFLSFITHRAQTLLCLSVSLARCQLKSLKQYNPLLPLMKLRDLFVSLPTFFELLSHRGVNFLCAFYSIFLLCNSLPLPPKCLYALYIKVFPEVEEDFSLPPLFHLFEVKKPLEDVLHVWDGEKS